ncbi:MAG: hypothetical protein WCH82_02375 [Mycobacteriaceae bacterium]
MASSHPIRIAAAGILAGAALVVPALAVSATPASTTATGQCLAWFGSRDDGQCIGYSNGSPTYIGTPNLGVFGPNYGGLGVTSGPLLPGQTINQGLAP